MPDGILFRQGDSPHFVFFVKSGEVTLTMMADGKPASQFRAREGCLLGLPAVVAGQPYTMTAQANSDSTILSIAAEVFLELASSGPGLRNVVLRILAAEVRQARQALADLSSA